MRNKPRRTQSFLVDNRDPSPLVRLHNLHQGTGDLVVLRQHVKRVEACGATPQRGRQVRDTCFLRRHSDQTFVVTDDAVDVVHFYLPFHCGKKKAIRSRL